MFWRRSASNRLVRRRPSLDFSVTGAVFVAMMLFMGLAAVNSQANLLFGVFGLMIGILSVSGLISRLVLNKLRVQRVLPEAGCVGHTMTITYRMTNGKRFWPSLSVSIAELDGVEAFTTQPQAYMLHAAPQMTASVPAIVVPKRRGLCRLDRYQVATSFPFGFIKRAVTEGRQDTMLVYPPLAQVHPTLLAMCRSADLTGETTRPTPGGSDEFYGVKQYRAGDNPRWIYWRRSARAGTLVSKEMTKVSPPRIMLLVDTFLASTTAQDQAAVEQVIGMAASLASVALEQGLSVGLCLWSEQWITIAPTRGKRHREDVLSVLATASANTEHGLAEMVERCRPLVRTGTTPILFTPRQTRQSQFEGFRGGTLNIWPDSPRARNWFTFEPGVDFANCGLVADPSQANWTSRARSSNAGKEAAAAPIPR
jgi:uncharacterized protein (DUF58 family)